MTGDKIIVRVGQQDIDATDGVPGWDGNPISRAASRTLGGTQWWAFDTYVCAADATHYRHSRRSRAFLRRYQAGLPVMPATFVLVAGS